MDNIILSPIHASGLDVALAGGEQTLSCLNIQRRISEFAVSTGIIALRQVHYWILIGGLVNFNAEVSDSTNARQRSRNTYMHRTDALLHTTSDFTVGNQKILRYVFITPISAVIARFFVKFARDHCYKKNYIKYDMYPPNASFSYLSL